MDKPSCTLTVAEVADLVGVHRITLYAAIKDGTFELVPIRVGRKILFPRSRVEQLLGLRPDTDADPVQR